MQPLEGVILFLKVAAVALLIGAGAIYRDHVYQLGYDAAVEERAARDSAAVLARTTQNVATAERQGAVNLKITEAKHEELAPVRERIVTRRVYVGSAICGPAAPAQTEIPAGGDEADSPGRLVRPDVERDLVALKLAVEEHLATGRACQETARENGMGP